MEVISIIIIISFFSFFCPKKIIIYYFIIAAFALSVLAFFYSPTQYADLFHHYLMLDEFKFYGWNYVVDTHYFQRQPIFAVYAYLISFFPFKGFLPAITVFLAYLFPFILINKISIKYNIKKEIIVLSFLFILFTMSYLGVMGGIRNMLAFSLFGYTLYSDLVEKKNKIICFTIYIALCLFHSSIVILVVFRLLVALTKKRLSFFFLLVVSLLWPLLSLYIIKILGLLKGVVFFSFLQEQVEGYINGGTQFVYSTASIRLLSLISIFSCLIFCIFMQKYIKDYPDKYLRFFLITILFTIGGVFQYDLFVRMVCFLIFSSPFVILIALSVSSNGTNRNVTILKMFLNVELIFVSVISLVFYTWSEYTKINFTFF